MKLVPGPGREALGVALGAEEQEEGGGQEHGQQQQREEEHLLIRSVWRVTETVISFFCITINICNGKKCGR